MRKVGLYDPAWERDACGVGMVANVDGTENHKLIEQALEVLVNLEHRGAAGSDPDTGDGAGILFKMPHTFFNRVRNFGSKFISFFVFTFLELTSQPSDVVLAFVGDGFVERQRVLGVKIV